MASLNFKGARPKGLRKFRGTQIPRLANPLTTTILPDTNIVESDKEENISSGDISDSSSTSAKRKPATSGLPPRSEQIRVTTLYWDYSHTCSTHLDRLNKWKIGAKFMDTSAIVGPGQAPSNTMAASFSLEDWKELRDLATEAKNTYDGEILCRMICSIGCSLLRNFRK
jgi:hypothetical protein